MESKVINFWDNACGYNFFCCHGNRKLILILLQPVYNYNLQFAGTVKPVNDILGRNPDHSACIIIIIMDVDYVILHSSQLESTLHYVGQ